ncbi:MAG: RNA-binding protein [Oscillatoria sp. SIO1A7]|nr:RNA-binding protein [Oscillatoria sp. SIO1A7]
MSIRLYIGNLPKEVDRKKLQDVFADAGDSVTTKVIKDRKGKCRGFGFVTVKTEEEADQIIEKYNGYKFEESELKIEKAMPRAKKKDEKEEETTTAPRSKPTITPASEKQRRGGGNQNKSRRNNNNSNSEPEAIQPDPRWASALEELKKQLAQEVTSS